MELIRHVMHRLPTTKSKFTIVLVATNLILRGFRDLGRSKAPDSFFCCCLINFFAIILRFEKKKKKKKKKKKIPRTSVY